MRIEEMTITNEMRNYINNIPITGYTLIIPFKFNDSEYQVLAARRSMTTKKYNEPNNIGKPKWMTYEECTHETWTPSLQYYNVQIFEKHIPNYVHEWTQKGKVIANLIKEEFPDLAKENHPLGNKQPIV
ncbi:hypothetical protein F8M41_013018 [Gigaspora margarita]|uniref:Uncharacterized protein n=1 Tax=Gigaspora margarita TaxID=4874 RepID=A0A8H4ASV5_GIGMA|nr:hypothetical protein F8M41_013018 [Gigaspora margarita]